MTQTDEERGAFLFDRYINGRLMADGVQINRERNLEGAMVSAAIIAERGPKGEVPVLIYRADLAPTSLGAVKVKPLQWAEHENLWRGESIAGVYYIFAALGKFHAYIGSRSAERVEFDTVEPAQAACQAHHKANILAPLEPVQPDPRVAAAIAEYMLDDPLQNIDERVGREAAVRGMMVRLGLYAEFEKALAAFDTTGGRTVYEPYPGAFDDIFEPETGGKSDGHS